MSNTKIAVIGGDRRQALLATAVAAEGYECAVFAIDGADIGGATRSANLEGALKNAAAVVLPLPVSRDGKRINTPLYGKEVYIDTVKELSSDNALFLGGMINKEHFKDKKVCDYYEKEELQLLNTIPTAEGAIAIAMDALPTTLHGTECLIMGGGRVGKCLAIMLGGIGAKVSVATRNPAEKAVFSILGHRVLEYRELGEKISDYGVIFNTVPALLLTDELLGKVKSTTPVIDLATHPGGVDATAAKNMGKNVIWALGLPGKVAPVTAGEYISKTVLGILREENII